MMEILLFLAVVIVGFLFVAPELSFKHQYSNIRDLVEEAEENYWSKNNGN